MAAGNVKGMVPLLQVFDMPASLHFYRELLGFKVIDSSGNGDNADWVYLKLDHTELMLNTAYESHERPPLQNPNRYAAHGDITLYYSCPGVEQAYAFFSGKGIEIKKPFITSYGFKAITFKDPDGYTLCFQWPVPVASP